MTETLKQQAKTLLLKLSKKQPYSAIAAMVLFFIPAGLVAFLLGPVAFAGAILYLACLFAVGEVSVKWVPLKDRLKLNTTRLIVEEDKAVQE